MEIFYRFGNFLPLPSRGTFLKRHEEHAAVSRTTALVEGMETTAGAQGGPRKNEVTEGGMEGK